MRASHRKRAYYVATVTIQHPMSREAFWHEYAKIPRHARQNSITRGDFIEFWLRICEGTEQILATIQFRLRSFVNTVIFST